MAKKGRQPIYNRKSLELQTAQQQARQRSAGVYDGAQSNEGTKLALGVEQEIKAVSARELVEELREKNEAAIKEAANLPEGVVPLFKLTMDGAPTPVEHEETIVNDPSISYKEVFEAIRLGIQAGTYTSYQNTKER